MMLETRITARAKSTERFPVRRESCSEEQGHSQQMSGASPDAPLPGWGSLAPVHTSLELITGRSLDAWHKGEEQGFRPCGEGA